jgi:DNA polymerase
MRDLFTRSLFNIPFEEIQRKAENCQLCRLKESRRRVVFGEGNLNADLLFIGEAPGEVEDQQGRPFVGPAGKSSMKSSPQSESKGKKYILAMWLNAAPPKTGPLKKRRWRSAGLTWKHK